MSMKQILVGIDFSEESLFAAEEAVNVARHTGAEITLVHVAFAPDLVETAGYPNQTVLDHYKKVIDEQVAESRRQLREIAARLSQDGLVIHHRLFTGYPDAAIPAAASELSADLVIVGTHGRTGFRRLLLGSVSERVVRLCERNVMVARPGAEGEGGYRRILVPTDFSPSAEAALRLARDLAAPEGSIDLVHFWQVPTALIAHSVPAAVHEPALAPVARAISESAVEQGRELVERFRGGRFQLSFETFEDRAIEGIRKRAPGYDLLVLGSHGRRGVRRFLLGSVAETTVRHAPCSVAIARAG